MTDPRAFVLDASAAAAILFREPDGWRVSVPLFRAETAVVPQIFHLELANIGRSKVRRKELDQATARAVLDEVEGWPLDVTVVPWLEAWTLALETGLTVYAAAYLQLASSSDLGLLTLDDALGTAAGARSIL